MTTRIGPMISVMDGLVKRAANEDAEERRKLLAARTDLASGLRAHLASKPLDEVKRFLAAMPDPKAARGLQGAELAEYNRLAGKGREKLTSFATLLDDGSMRMNTILPSDARALAEAGAPNIQRGSR